ncbi:putative ssDNA binding protein [Lineolata rhizophorae]|uniref:Putative ssDNA binding protein n=1 Tax=Lineolata rhizophorae TaxID=578093 RepID=A0A6A6P1G5_9PEZI|nr:putative ssDNA binding protein [Lineolata rhizophorae]
MAASFSPLRAFRPVASAATSATRSFSSTTRASFARMTVIGRLAAEPELTETSTGRQIVRYALGTSFGSGENKKTSWFRVTNFDEPGARRDFLLSLPKGTLMCVEADANMHTFEDNQGEKRTILQLTQRTMEALSRPRPVVESSEEATS